jgi:membrane-bound lytic murein transglycosylase D
MRLESVARRVTVVLLLSALILTAASPGAFAQSSQQPATSTNVQSVIDRAEEAFRLGEEAHKKGLTDIARKMFDQAVDIVHESGISLRDDLKLEAYYRQLVSRIHKYEARPDDSHQNEQQTESEQRPEKVEPALLDELSNLKDDELATTTPEGIKIFGKYDFDFSVAPPVFQYINYFVGGRGRSTMEVGLQRSGRYRQMAEKIFKEERIPLDLIWLAQAESVWKPNALSHAAAKGIWQFIPSTGTRYGLGQTSWVDDRSHPEKSTRAAARYLRFLHDYFAGDWLLAMAAYNSGEHRVASAVAKCGYADFWELYRRNLLPSETRNYVPIILAITIISKNQKRYGFNVTPDHPLNYETFDLPAQTDLKVVAELIGVPYETVRDLNPELRHGTSPPGARYTIKLPKGMKKQFEVAYAALPEEQRVRKVVVAREEVARSYRPVYRAQTASYQIRRGDTLASLARRYGVSAKELAKMNRMSARGTLRKGQALRIPQIAKASKASRSSKSARIGRYKEAKVTTSRLRAKSKVKSKAATKSRSSVKQGKSSRRSRR